MAEFEIHIPEIVSELPKAREISDELRQAISDILVVKGNLYLEGASAADIRELLQQAAEALNRETELLNDLMMAMEEICLKYDSSDENICKNIQSLRFERIHNET